MKVICKCCNKEFDKHITQIKKTSNHFCSRSCAAKYNNKLYPKRSVKGKCAICFKPIPSKRKFCDECRKQTFAITENLTIEEYKNSRGFKCNHFTGIRDKARRIAKQNNIIDKCAVCGYTNHVVVCHIKSISSFSPETKINEVNDINNLIGLCPNHHWEFDHGILDIENLKNTPRQD